MKTKTTDDAETNGDQTVKPPRRKLTALQFAGRTEKGLIEFDENDTRRILMWLIEGLPGRFPSAAEARDKAINRGRVMAETLYPPESAT